MPIHVPAGGSGGSPGSRFHSENHRAIPEAHSRLERCESDSQTAAGRGLGTALADESLVLYGAIGNLQALVDDGKSFAQLLLVNAQGRIGIESIPAHKCVETLLAEEPAEGGHFFRGAIERRHRLPCLAAANQFEDAEQSNGAHRSHRRMLGLHLGSKLFHDYAHSLRILDETILFIDTNGR